MSYRRALSAGFMPLTCIWTAVAHASASPPRSEGRPQQRGVVAEIATDPLNELQRTVRSIGAVVRRRVPDWSPEADAMRWQVNSLLAGVLDYEQIGRSALGTDWDRLTTPQHGAFLRALSALTNHAIRIGASPPGYSLRFVSETILGQRPA